MTRPGTNYTASSLSSRCGTDQHAYARRNDQDHDVWPGDQIRVQAYERYIERGMQPSDLRDWLEVERDYQNLSETIRQS